MHWADEAVNVLPKELAVRETSRKGVKVEVLRARACEQCMKEPSPAILYDDKGKAVDRKDYDAWHSKCLTRFACGQCYGSGKRVVWVCPRHIPGHMDGLSAPHGAPPRIAALGPGPA